MRFDAFRKMLGFTPSDTVKDAASGGVDGLIADLWADSQDTFAIARTTGLTEAAVYNARARAQGALDPNATIRKTGAR